MRMHIRSVLAGMFVGVVCATAQAAVFPVTFTKLTGLTGGVPSGTAVYRADLSGVPLSDILSFQITDNSAALGGSGGQFTGFDLDAVKLSYTSVDTAGDAALLAGLPVFDFGAGTVFNPGVQRAPVEPNLFGSVGSTINNGIATLGSFDANSTTDPTAFGFASLGDGGSVAFNLSAPTATSGLQLYIGEVGDNGEVAAGSITVSNAVVPEPGTLALLGAGILPLIRRRRR